MVFRAPPQLRAFANPSINAEGFACLCCHIFNLDNGFVWHGLGVRLTVRPNHATESCWCGHFIWCSGTTDSRWGRIGFVGLLLVSCSQWTLYRMLRMRECHTDKMFKFTSLHHYAANMIHIYWKRIQIVNGQHCRKWSDFYQGLARTWVCFHLRVATERLFCGSCMVVPMDC